MQALTLNDPSRVGPYDLRGRLGSGGMGVVYLGFSAAGEPVAIKCLPHAVDNDLRRRLGREADVLSAINHPRVAGFLDADVRAERPWIAMHYIAGPSLAAATVPLAPAPLHQLAQGLAEALQALHRQGLTHRDVKPGNIILTHEGPVLVDFGIASGSDLTSLTMAGMVVGTPEWMPPEQLSGQHSGPSTDIWGWAAVSVFAATGRSPFGSGAIEALAHRIRYDQPDLRGVPDWLRGAVAAGLDKNPDRRPTAARLSGPDGISTIALPRPITPTSTAPRRPGRPAAPPPPPPPSTPLHRTTAEFAPPPLVAAQARPGPPLQRGRSGNAARTTAIASAIVLVALLVIGGVYLLIRDRNTGITSAQAPSAAPPISSAPSTPTPTPATPTPATPTPTPTTPSPTLTPTPTPTPTFDPSSLTVDKLQSDGVCDTGCTLSGAVSFVHPSWGDSTLVTTTTTAGGGPGVGSIAVYDAAGTVRYVRRLTSVYSLAPGSPSTDVTGHVFLTYNPGRYDGVIVLAGVSDGMADFGSLPLDNGSPGRFYNASTKDNNGDGILDIDQKSNNCTPDCASGKISNAVYRWNPAAEDYLKS